MTNSLAGIFLSGQIQTRSKSRVSTEVDRWNSAKVEIFRKYFYFRGNSRHSVCKIPRNSGGKRHGAVLHAFVKQHVAEHDHVDVKFVTCIQSCTCMYMYINMEIDMDRWRHGDTETRKTWRNGGVET
jgi:hypothetical protein